MASVNGGVIGVTITPAFGKYTSFTAPGTYTTGGCTSVDVLVVAGGGGGSGGGGGAGGVRLISSHPIPTSPIPVTVGSGGAGSPAWPCASSSAGTPSNFGAPSPIAATGGGLTGYNNQPSGQPGGPGGSAGGAGGSYRNNSGGSGNVGGYSPPEGNPSGSSAGDAATYSANGGGGGACQSGGNAGSPGTKSYGGNGKDVSPIFGTYPQPHYPSYPAGYQGAGHVFGGGGAGLSPPSDSPTNVGGTGGGGSMLSPAPDGRVGLDGHGGGGGMGNNYTGGDGIVIVKEPNVFKASGVWSLKGQFINKKQDLWS